MCKYFSAFSKCLLYTVNILTFLIGVAIVTVGSLIVNDRSFVSNLLSNKTEVVETSARIVTEKEIKDELDVLFSTAGAIILCVGIFLILLSIIGFVGLIKNSKCLLMIYVFVITILTIAQTVAIVLAAVYQQLLRNHLTEFLINTLSHYGDDKDIRGKWNWKMTRLDCCGVTGWNDFVTLKNMSSNAKIDASKKCCDPKKVEAKCENISFEDLSIENTKPGCSLKAFEAFKDHYYADIAIVAFLIVANGLAIVAALSMDDAHDDEDDLDGHYDDKYHLERSRKDSTANNLQNLSQMRNPGIASRDSCFSKIYI